MKSAVARHRISNFRPDVEGLRAIAVGMVLVYHLFQTWAPGGFAGVDVFFVISGFLITGHLAKEIEQKGHISLLEFYARRAKRLFPAAGIVLLATTILAAIVLPSTRLREAGGDVFAAALYYVNWHLAARSVDYLAEGSTPSPVQHFWSLAVEEQYYLVWPVMLSGALILIRRRLSPKLTMWLTLIAIGLPSLVYSIWSTNTNPGPAYFITPTRMWELAIGGAVALAADKCRTIPHLAADIVGWAGMLCIVATLLLVTPDTPWPGFAAALPTLGAAAIIAGGFSSTSKGPVSILGTRAFCWVGALSYSLYLWHWPLIVFLTTYLGVSSLTLIAAASVLVASIGLSWLTVKAVENPIRFSTRMTENPKYALSTGLNISLAAATAGLLLVVNVLQHSGDRAENLRPSQALGARVLGTHPSSSPAGIPADKIDWYTPTAATAVLDHPEVYEDGCQLSFNVSIPKPCIYGDPKGKITVAVVGDSKVVQWMPALQELAKAHHWRLVLNGKASCGFTSLPLKRQGKPYPECTDWKESVFKELLERETPDFLITSAGNGSVKLREREVEGLLKWWRPLSSAGIKIIAIANNPNPSSHTQLYECVAEHPDKLTLCAFPTNPGSGSPAMKAAAARLPNAHFIDLNDAICPTEMCPAIIGNVLIYRQGSHITRTYIRSLAPRLERSLAEAGLR